MSINDEYDTAIEVVIFHSNDLHSRLEQAAKTATIIEQGRLKYGPEQVIAVDLGDHMDRARMETEGTDGLVHQAIIEATAYDVVTLGNNEGLTFSAEQLDAVYSDSSFQVICCNLHKLHGDNPSWLSSSTIIERAGLSVGFIAATANFYQFYELMGWQTTEPIIEIKKRLSEYGLLAMLLCSCHISALSMMNVLLMSASILMSFLDHTRIICLILQSFVMVP